LQNNNQLNNNLMLQTRKTILLGEGVHQHTLEGKFEMENDTMLCCDDCGADFTIDGEVLLDPTKIK
jgi:hypothetical protein